MTTPRALRPAPELPAPVARLIEQSDWEGLIRALDDGLPANLQTQGGVPLLETVLYALEQAPDSPTPEPAPMALLEAFLRAGLTRGTIYDGAATVVSMVVHYGQWQWAHRLLEEGFPAESEAGSALAAMTSGRLHRAIALGQATLGQMEDAAPELPVPAPEPTRETGPGAPQGQVVAFPSARSRTTEPPTPPPAPDPPRGVPLVFDDPGQSGALLAMVKALVAHGAALEKRTPPEASLWPRRDVATHFTPLLHAIYHLDQGMVRALVAAGADLEKRPEDLPYRPLEMAVMRGSVDIVEDLVAAGAPMDLDQSHAPAVRMMAHPLLLCARMGLPQLVEPLMAALPPDRRQWLGGHAMNAAAAYGVVPVMRALRLQGIPYDVATDTNGFRPMHQAAFAGHVDALAFLLRRGQKWDSRSKAGLTARDVLQSHHPGLLARFGLEPEGNVTALFGRRSRPKP